MIDSIWDVGPTMFKCCFLVDLDLLCGKGKLCSKTAHISLLGQIWYLRPYMVIFVSFIFNIRVIIKLFIPLSFEPNISYTAETA